MENHIGEIVTIIIGILGVSVLWGKVNEKIKTLEEKVRGMEEDGSAFARENIGSMKERINYHEQRQGNIESKHDKVIQTLEDIKISLARIFSKLDK